MKPCWQTHPRVVIASSRPPGEAGRGMSINELFRIWLVLATQHSSTSFQLVDHQASNFQVQWIELMFYRAKFPKRFRCNFSKVVPGLGLDQFHWASINSIHKRFLFRFKWYFPINVHRYRHNLGCFTTASTSTTYRNLQQVDRQWRGRRGCFDRPSKGLRFSTLGITNLKIECIWFQ